VKVSLVSLSVIGLNWGGDRDVILFFLFLDFKLAIHIFHKRFLNRCKMLHLALSQPHTVIIPLDNSYLLLLKLTKLHNSFLGLIYLITQLSFDINNYFIDRRSFCQLTL
jgi:hypothetical protein